MKHMKDDARTAERGGTLLGLVVGLLIGLAVALGVALYVSKVPVPFVDKLPQRSPEQDAAEAARNKNWDPNAPLSGKSPPPPNRAASSEAPSADAPSSPAAAGSGGKEGPSAAPKVADPKLEVTGLFIQAGAFNRLEEAEQQRAKLAMLGFAARISEREQSSRTVYRVRVGPFETREETNAPLERLQAAGVEVSLVRVERNPAPQ